MLEGNDGDDRILGGPGDDTLYGGSGDDLIKGGAGDDTLSGDGGTDRMHGQRGTDVVTFADSPEGVVVNMASRRVHDDGYGNEDRRLAGFEGVVGTPFGDTLIHSGKGNIFVDPGGGADTIGVRARGARRTSILGNVEDASPIVRFEGWFKEVGRDGAADLLELIDDDGGFALEEELIEDLLDRPIRRRSEHTLLLEAEDAAGNVTRLKLLLARGVWLEPAVDVAVEDGELVLDPGLPLPDGVHLVTATASDLAGNVSVLSDAASLTVDTTAPAIRAAVVTREELPDPPTLPSGGTGTGTGVGGGGSDTGTSGGGGEAGTAGTAIVGGTIGVGEPLSVSLAEESHTGFGAESGFTNDVTPTVDVHVRGSFLDTLSPESVYELEFSLNSVVVDSVELAVSWGGLGHSSRTLSFTTEALADGMHSVVALVRELATGDVAAESEVFLLTVDTVPPAPPSLALGAGSDTGRSDSDWVTNDTTPTLVVEGDEDSLVSVFFDFVGPSGPEGAAPESQIPIFDLAPGTYGPGDQSLDGPLVDGEYVIELWAVDPAGNLTTVSDHATITIDTVAPVAPRVGLAPMSDTGISDSDNLTADNTPFFQVLAEADSQIEVFVDDVSFQNVVLTGVLGLVVVGNGGVVLW